MKRKYIIIEVIIKERFGDKWGFVSGEILFNSNNLTDCENFLREDEYYIRLNSELISHIYFYDAINRSGEYNLKKIKLVINRETIKKSIFNNHYELYKELKKNIRVKKLENVIN